jgi:molybdopterin converting factor small subunit
MTKYNAKNERIKRQYFAYLKEATGKSDATIDRVRAALLLY